MENDKQFFALVGATGSGKNTLLDRLEKHFRSKEGACAVPCDSTMEAFRVTTSFTRIDQNIDSRTSPIGKLLQLWAVLSDQIENEIQPALQRGQRVIMNGFGGTAFAESSALARGPHERAAIQALHETLIEKCVRGIMLPPPIYIWLKVSPEVALKRRRAERSLPKVSDPMKYIKELNERFELYGRLLKGQIVHMVDADRPLDEVFRTVLDLIEPAEGLAQAA